MAADPNQLLDQLEGLSHKSFTDEGERFKAITKAERLVRRLETPVDSLLRMIWMENFTNVAFKVCSDLGVFRELTSGPKTTDELAKSGGAEPALLRRFLRILAANHYLGEKDVDLWAPTEMTDAMANGLSAGIDFLHDIAAKSCFAVPEALKEDGYKNPTDRLKAIWHRGHNTELEFFPYLEANPEKHATFNNTMAVGRMTRLLWHQVYPVQERLSSRYDASNSEALLVDVGGGIGFDLQNFENGNPDHPGTLIIEDLDTVVAKAQTSATIKVVGHSFMNPQPVKGAAMYFMGSILHDWPDMECKVILGHLKDALKPGYSRILLREPVVPAKGANLLYSAQDLTMMTLFSAKERTLAEWEELAGAVGLKVAKIFEYPDGRRHLIELILKDDTPQP